jgi:peptidoglycan/LPS O-acetylase OafA/YrhL
MQVIEMNAATGPVRSGEVDALRCFAMLSVIALHAHLLPFGWIGVWLFYVISGYVVTLSVLRRRAASGGTMPLRDYARRRVARILPVYYAYLCLGLAVATIIGHTQDSLSLASLFLFFDNLTMATGQGRIAGWPSGHLWTLSVEMQFYLVFGAALCRLPVRVLRIALILLVPACLIGRFAYGVWLDAQGWPPLDAAFAVYVAPGLHFDLFAFGALLALAAQDGTLPRLARPLFFGGMIALAVYAAAYCAVNLVVRNEQGIDTLRNIVSGILFGEHREALVYSAVGAAMTGLVALAATRDPLLRPLLGARIVQRIGEISYGGYLFHPLGLIAASALLGLAGWQVRGGGPLAHGAQFLIGTALTLLLAELSFRWFETPCRRWIDRTRTSHAHSLTLTRPGLETP